MPEIEMTQPLGTSVTMYRGESAREMIDAGVFYGRKKTKTNPKMRPFVFANRAGIEIINLQKTADALEKAVEFIKETVGKNKDLGMIVGTEPAAESAVRAVADRFKLPYVTGRWVGGTITNFPIIAKRIDHLKKTREGLASGAYDAYTKKERLKMDREVKRLEILMGGLENLSREPDFLIMVNPVVNVTAVREARRRKIPIIAFANVDADPDVIDYLVPGNDKAKSSITWFLEKMEKAIAEGMAIKMAPTEEKKEEVKA
jgi:small subunit ribosomal protein S2